MRVPTYAIQSYIPRVKLNKYREEEKKRHTNRDTKGTVNQNMREREREKIAGKSERKGEKNDVTSV